MKNVKCTSWQWFSNLFHARHFTENYLGETLETHWSKQLWLLRGGRLYLNILLGGTWNGKLSLEASNKVLKKTSHAYFIFTCLTFYSYLCLQLWKYNLLTFLMAISKKGHKMEMLLHYLLYLYLGIFLYFPKGHLLQYILLPYEVINFLQIHTAQNLSVSSTLHEIYIQISLSIQTVFTQFC